MQLKQRLARLQAIAPRPGRYLWVDRYEGETVDQAIAAEHPGASLGPADVVISWEPYPGPRPVSAQ